MLVSGKVLGEGILESLILACISAWYLFLVLKAKLYYDAINSLGDCLAY